MTAEKKKKIPLYARFSKPLAKNLYVEQANFWKRFAAFIIDFILAALIAILAYMTAIHPLWYQKLGGYEKNEALIAEQFASGLYVEEGGANIRLPELASTNRFVSEDVLADELSFWNRLDDEEETIVVSDVYYDYALRLFYNNYDGFIFNESTYYDVDKRLTPNYDRDILLMNGEANDFIVNKTAHEKGTKTYYTFTYQEGASKAEINKFWEKQYFIAVDENLRKMPTYFSLQSAITRATQLMVAISYLIGGLVFHLLVPLLSKNGQTIGKMVNKIAVVNKEGYRVLPRQIILRTIIIDVVEIIGSMYLYFIPILLTMAVITLSRQQRAIHDFIAGTRLINFSNSYIFKDENEAKVYMEARKSGKDSNIYPGGGLGIAENKEKVGDPLK